VVSNEKESVGVPPENGDVECLTQASSAFRNGIERPLESVGELLMIFRIALVAACCSRASARRFSSSGVLASSAFRGLLATPRAALALAFAGVMPRRVGFFLWLHRRCDRKNGRRQSRGGPQQGQEAGSSDEWWR